MDKALEIGQTSVTGSFHLLIGKVASTLILAIGTIILQIYILQSDYGLYTVALIPATTFLLFQDWGIGTALIRFCALGKATKSGNLRNIVVAGLTFEVATGIALTIVSLLTAKFYRVSRF